MTDIVAQDQLKAYVRRIEALDDEIKVLNEDKSEVYAESKANGFDNKILRKVVAERRKGAAEREEQDALFQLYWDAVHGVVPAHVEIIEEFDPATGEFKPAGNGASGAEEETQVATVRASSSANSSLASGTPGADLPAAGVSTTSAGTVGDEDRQPIPPPAEGNTPTSAGHGDRGAVVPSAAPVVADRTKPNPICQDPEDCGVEASWNHVCGSCLRRGAQTEAARAVQ